MNIAESKSAAEALVVVVPLPDGRGLVTVRGSGVGSVVRMSPREALRARDVLLGLMAGAAAHAFGVNAAVSVGERADGWRLTLCGEELPGAEPMGDAEARRSRIIQRLAAVLREERCSGCGCSGTCPWALGGEVDPDVVACVTCACCWCGSATEEFCARQAATKNFVVCGDPVDRLRQAIAAFDRERLAGSPAEVRELHAAAARIVAIEDARLGQVEVAARALDQAGARSLAPQLRDGAPAIDVLAELRAEIGDSGRSPMEQQALVAVHELLSPSPAGAPASRAEIEHLIVVVPLEDGTAAVELHPEALEHLEQSGALTRDESCRVRLCGEPIVGPEDPCEATARRARIVAQLRSRPVRLRGVGFAGTGAGTEI